VAALTTATALATSPRLDAIRPAGGPRGSELELRFEGARLENAEDIIFYSPGFEVVQLQPATKTNACAARVRIAPDGRLGEHLLRVRTASGVSEVRPFYVSPFPNLEEKEPNNDPAMAQPVPLNTTVNGACTAEDLDCFAFEVRQGQAISVEVEAMRLGRAAFDAAVAILDREGNLVARADDTALLMQDPCLSIRAPKDGSYILQVHETTYGGNADFTYRLHLGTFPRPSAVYPAGGQAGQTLAVRFIGDAGGDLAQSVKLPDAPQEKLGLFAERAGVPSPSPNWIRVSPFPNVLESGTNQSRPQATATELLPVALNGIVSRPGEHDWFRFKAKKGQALDVQMYARRLRSPLDSVLDVFNPKGEHAGGNDDSAGTDSYLKFTPGEDGDYFVRVRDHLDQGGPDYVYRVEITPVGPGLTLSIPQVARNDSQTRQHIVVPRGNRFATLLSARRANFSGDLAVRLEGLPPGLALHANTMAANTDAMPLVFEAAPDTPLGGRLLDLTAAQPGVTNGVRGVFRHDIEMVYGPNNTVYYGMKTDKLFVGVAEEAPFKLRLIEPRAPIVQAGQLNVKVAAERRPGFDEPVRIQMVWNPPGLSSQPEITLPKGATQVDFPLNASGDAPTRAWKIAVLGSATVEGGTVWASSQLASLAVGPPFVLGKIEPVVVEPGGKTNLVCKLEQKTPFEGAATVRLYGLPERVTTTDLLLTKDAREVVFPLTVATNCPPGSHRAVFCSLTLTNEGEHMTQTLASGGVLRIVPPKRTETNVVAAARSGN
jgi:hypothetical protein